MGSRRRSYIVLGLVLVLIIASAYAVTSKPTRQGIDLAGGTELVYEARATGANTTINVEDVDRSVDLIRERVDALGVAEPEISRIGERQISVSLPEVQNAQDAIDQVGQTSQLSFYDFEPNVIPPDPDIADAVERPFNRLYDAVEGIAEGEARVLREGRQAALHPRRPVLPLRREHARAPGRPRLEGGGPLPQVRRQAARGVGRRGGARRATWCSARRRRPTIPPRMPTSPRPGSAAGSSSRTAPS